MYTLESLYELKNCYEKLIEKSGGRDPDFPMLNFGDSENTYKASNNVTKIDLNSNKGNEESVDDLFKL